MIMHKYTAEQLAWLIQHKSHGYKWLAEKFKQTFGIEKSQKALQQVLNKRGHFCGNDPRFKKGHIAYNKGKKGGPPVSPATCFKKGNRPHSYLPVGSEVIDRDGYIKLKIADPNIWMFKQRWIYQQHYSVQLKSNDVVIFLDGNKQNLAIHNLIAVPRGVHGVMCKRGLHQLPDAELKKTMAYIIQLELAANSKERNKP